MFKNYFRTALRNFWPDKTFFVINVLGLSSAYALHSLYLLIVQFEMSYDKVETDANRIYRAEFPFIDQLH
jgi:putative ABC transport system permease protein